MNRHKSCSRSRQVELGRWRVSQELLSLLHDHLTARTEAEYLNVEHAISLAEGSAEANQLVPSVL